MHERSIKCRGSLVGLCLRDHRFHFVHGHDVFPSSGKGGTSRDSTASLAETNSLNSKRGIGRMDWKVYSDCLGDAPLGISAEEWSSHPVRIRFHDRRHTACTRMLEGGGSFHIVAQI